jgi:hypothetical protein
VGIKAIIFSIGSAILLVFDVVVGLQSIGVLPTPFPLLRSLAIMVNYYPIVSLVSHVLFGWGIALGFDAVRRSFSPTKNPIQLFWCRHHGWRLWKGS